MLQETLRFHLLRRLLNSALSRSLKSSPCPTPSSAATAGTIMDGAPRQGGNERVSDGASLLTRGIIGAIPEGFSEANDDGSKLLALLRGAGDLHQHQQHNNNSHFAPPPYPQHQQSLQEPRLGLGSNGHGFMPPPPPPGIGLIGLGSNFLPPGIGVTNSSNNTMVGSNIPPGIGISHHPMQQQQQQQSMPSQHLGGWSPDPFARPTPSHSAGGGGSGGGGSNLLFGGNSTWSMSSQESSQGLGSLWSSPSTTTPSNDDLGEGPHSHSQHNMRMPGHNMFVRQAHTSSATTADLQGRFQSLNLRPLVPPGVNQVRRPLHSAADDQQAAARLQHHQNDQHQRERQDSAERNNLPPYRTHQGGMRGGEMNTRSGPRRQSQLGFSRRQPRWNPMTFQRQLMDIYLTLLPTKDETAMKKKCFKKIQRILKKRFKDSTLHMFGSSANNLGICRNHDIDLSIEVKESEEQIIHDSPSDSDSEDGSKDEESAEDAEKMRNRNTQMKVVKAMAKLLRKNRMSRVFAIPKARVPIVKFIEPETGIECDICVNNLLAVENTLMLKRYSEIDVRLKHLVILIKHWSKCRGVNGAFKGTLSSYAYVIMVIHLLQSVQPAVLPRLQSDQYRWTVDKKVDGWECKYNDERELFHEFGRSNNMTTGELLQLFFEYWGYRHNYKRTVISIRTGEALTKEDKGWTTRKQGDNHLICVEDPFQLSNDLGRVVSRKTIFFLRDEFKRAADILNNAADPIRSGLFQVLSDKEISDKMKHYENQNHNSRQQRNNN